MKIKNGKTNSTAENSVKYLCLCPCSKGNWREYFSNEFTDKILFVRPRHASSNVASRRRSICECPYKIILFYFIFHKCGDNETIPQHFYRELKGNKSYDYNKYNLRFLPISFTEWTQFLLSLHRPKRLRLMTSWWIIVFSSKTLRITVKPWSNRATACTLGER